MCAGPFIMLCKIITPSLFNLNIEIQSLDFFSEAAQHHSIPAEQHCCLCKNPLRPEISTKVMTPN